MFDPTKTEALKEKLNEIRESEASSSEQDQQNSSNPWQFLFIFALRIVCFYFSQVFILEKLEVEPFTWVQSTIIFFGLGAVASLFNRSI